MTSLWFSVDDTDISDDPCLGIFVASPSVIAAMLPRPKAPFVCFAQDHKGLKDNSSDSVSYESPIANPETPHRKPGNLPEISIFDQLN
jgi:hypothetical protein